MSWMLTNGMNPLKNVDFSWQGYFFSDILKIFFRDKVFSSQRQENLQKEKLHLKDLMI